MAARKRGNLLGKDYSVKADSNVEKNEDTRKTQDKHKKYKHFVEEDIEHKEGTEHKKKKPGKRINMGFLPSNYSFIKDFCQENGINAKDFINHLIEEKDDTEMNDYIISLPFKRGQYSIRRKGAKLDRINLEFSDNNYHELAEGSKRYETTISQYMNMIIEVYRKNIDTR